MAGTIKDWLIAHPGVDQVGVLGLTAMAGLAAPTWLPAEASTRTELYSALAGLCGLVLAAATFVCTLTYQAAGRHMHEVRKHYGVQLSRNWTAIIGSTFVAAFAALAALVVDERSRSVAAALTAYSLATVGLAFVRSVVWLRYTLFFEHVSDRTGEKVVVPFEPGVRSAG